MTLERYGIARADYDESFNPDISLGTLWCREFKGASDWQFWMDLTTFCEQTNTRLTYFVIDLRFDLLD